MNCSFLYIFIYHKYYIKFSYHFKLHKEIIFFSFTLSTTI